MAAVNALGAEQRIRQKRGQVTYDALIETCFDLLREKEFDQISIAELAQKAGYSVGAFYARFRSKDELFDAMVQQHVQNRRKMRQRQFEQTNDARLLHELLDETVRYYWGRRRFWRAALIRSITEPGLLGADAQVEPRVRGRAARPSSRSRRPRSDERRGSQREVRRAARVRPDQQHDLEPPRTRSFSSRTCSSRISCERSSSCRATMSSAPRAHRSRASDRRPAREAGRSEAAAERRGPAHGGGSA